MALKENIVKLFGTEDPTDEITNEKVGGLMADNASLKSDIEALKTRVTELETKNAELAKREELAKVGETYLKDMRDKAEAHYKLLRGEAVNADMLEVIKKADIAQAKAMVADFEKEIEEKIPGICSECGKPAKLNRRSSKEIAEEKKAEADYSDYKTGQ